MTAFIKRLFLPQARLETRLIGTRETSLKPPLAQFGGFLDLVQATATQQADRLAVTLTWQLSNADSVGFESVFVHVMQGEALVAQQDGAPLENLYPFSAWRKGDVWTETRFVLGVPRGCADCEIRVGVYRWSDGERAPVTNAQGEIIGTGWTLKAE